MTQFTKKIDKSAAGLHPRNAHRGRYDFTALCECSADLGQYVSRNPSGESTIDFADARAVLALNRALLTLHYGIQHWMIPAGYLCPPIPGRADYVHSLADLLAGDAGVASLVGRAVRVLDVGTGANCIYPIIGARAYGWKFVA